MHEEVGPGKPEDYAHGTALVGNARLSRITANISIRSGLVYCGRLTNRPTVTFGPGNAQTHSRLSEGRITI